ncbi:MAG: putative porin [Owenweeksia sp.]|nr:putative porin [Owenweeksia sp.]
MAYLGDSSAAFYDNYFFEEGAYRDSTGYNSFSNSLFIAGEIGKRSKLELKAGIKNLATRYGTNIFLFTTNSWGAIGELRGNISDRFNVNASLDYILLGDFDQSIETEGRAQLKILNSLNAYGGYHLQFKDPLLMEQFFFSNNFIWQNNFDREGYTSFHAGLKWGQK